MTEQLSHKAQELLNAFNKAEAKWTEEINQRNEFIRRRDHTIATQIDTINSVSQEVLDLTQKTKKLEDESKELLNRLNTEEAQHQKLLADKTSLTRMCLDARKEVVVWKGKYNCLKAKWKTECKRRVEELSEDEEDSNSNVPTKIAKASN